MVSDARSYKVKAKISNSFHAGAICSADSARLDATCTETRTSADALANETMGCASCREPSVAEDARDPLISMPTQCPTQKTALRRCDAPVYDVDAFSEGYAFGRGVQAIGDPDKQHIRFRRRGVRIAANQKNDTERNPLTPPGWETYEHTGGHYELHQRPLDVAHAGYDGPCRFCTGIRGISRLAGQHLDDGHALRFQSDQARDLHAILENFDHRCINEVAPFDDQPDRHGA